MKNFKNSPVPPPLTCHSNPLLTLTVYDLLNLLTNFEKTKKHCKFNSQNASIEEFHVTLLRRPLQMWTKRDCASLF